MTQTCSRFNPHTELSWWDYVMPSWQAPQAVALVDLVIRRGCDQGGLTASEASLASHRPAAPAGAG